MSAQDDLLLDVEGLNVRFATPEGPIHAVNGIDLKLHKGETLALLGESGSGKSVTMQAVIGLVRSPPGTVTATHARFDGMDLMALKPAELRKVRGPRIAMIFQDPFMSLDPTKTVGSQIGEMFRVHRGASRAEARKNALEMMDRVRIPAAAERIDDYPHQFSGGMSQRIVIASAIALDPDLVIADEPTTALDVTVQAQIMDLLNELRREMGMTMILITHDLALAAETADRAAIMYGGRIVETGPMESVFSDPRHPYAIGLLQSIPSMEGGTDRLQPILGTPPKLTRAPDRCSFEPRCAWSRPRCTAELPPLRTLAPARRCACHFAEEIAHDDA
ncbi:MAG: ABC transporter ATP-binding protein [Phycisphaerales bacterium]